MKLLLVILFTSFGALADDYYDPTDELDENGFRPPTDQYEINEIHFQKRGVLKEDPSRFCIVTLVDFNMFDELKMTMLAFHAYKRVDRNVPDYFTVEVERNWRDGVIKNPAKPPYLFEGREKFVDEGYWRPPYAMPGYVVYRTIQVTDSYAKFEDIRKDERETKIISEKRYTCLFD